MDWYVDVVWSRGGVQMLSSLLGKFLFILLATLCLLATPLQADNFSGLEGSKLEPSSARSDIITDAVKTMLGFTGGIDSIIVASDAAEFLELNLYFTGLEQLRIKAGVLDTGKDQQQQVSDVEVNMGDETSPMTMRFDLSDEFVEGDSLTSGFFRLRLFPAFTGLRSVSLDYLLPKKWYKEISAENLITDVALIPIGSAANLPVSRTQTPLPKPTRQLKRFSADSLSRFQWFDRQKLTVEARREKMVPVSRLTPASTPAVQPGTISPGTSDHTHEISGITPIGGPTIQPSHEFVVYRPIVIPILPSGGTVDETPQGPSDEIISLWDGLQTDVDFDFDRAYEISTVRLDLHPDKNPHSGIFYYFPSSYHMQWDPDQSCDFRIIYPNRRPDGAEGTIKMRTEVTADVGTGETGIIRKMTQAYAEKYNLTFKEVRPVPVDEDMRFSFEGTAYAYEISDDQIQVPPGSGLFDQIKISWTVNSATAEEMKAAMEDNMGLVGYATYKPGGEVSEQHALVQLALSDPRRIGRLELSKDNWRSNLWRNETPFPLVLKYLHALVLNKEGQKITPYIYSWDAGDKLIPPESQVSFDASQVRTWLDNEAERMWLEYRLAPDNDMIRSMIDSCTENPPKTEKWAKIIVFGVMDKTGAQVLQVQARSIYADPANRDVLEISAVTLEADGASVDLGPFYMPGGTRIEFEYRLTLVTDDNIYESTAWFNHTGGNMFINRSTIEQHFGQFPEIE